MITGKAKKTKISFGLQYIVFINICISQNHCNSGNLRRGNEDPLVFFIIQVITHQG